MSHGPLRIALFTGSRADYGLLRSLAKRIEASPDADLALIVSGTHLSAEHGATEREVAADGLPVAARIPVWQGDDSAEGAADDLAAAIPAYARALRQVAPDVVVVLGDRLEAFAMATAATVLSVPVAHVHGGEITEGAMDDALRHAITKLSYLHFVSTADHRRRVIQLGEQPERVFWVGAPIVDSLQGMELLDRASISRRFGVRMPRPTVLMTVHPAGMDVLPADELVAEVLAAMDLVPEAHVIITGSNSDIGNARVRDAISAYVAAHPDRADYVESFGQLGYLSAMAQAAAVIGNSSSTVLEAPVVGVPSVLIGDRQLGRPLATSVRTPAPERHAIAAALREAIASDPVVPGSTPFGEPGFAERALAVLLATDFGPAPRKAFHDIPEEPA